MAPTVYIETSIVSYLTARPSRDLIRAAHQQETESGRAFVQRDIKRVSTPGDVEAA